MSNLKNLNSEPVWIIVEKKEDIELTESNDSPLFKPQTSNNNEQKLKLNQQTTRVKL